LDIYFFLSRKLPPVVFDRMYTGHEGIVVLWHEWISFISRLTQACMNLSLDDASAPIVLEELVIRGIRILMNVGGLIIISKVGQKFLYSLLIRVDCIWMNCLNWSLGKATMDAILVHPISHHSLLELCHLHVLGIRMGCWTSFLHLWIFAILCYQHLLSYHHLYHLFRLFSISLGRCWRLCFCYGV